MGVIDYADAFLALEFGDLLIESFRLRPVHFRGGRCSAWFRCRKNSQL